MSDAELQAVYDRASARTGKPVTYTEAAIIEIFEESYEKKHLKS